MKFDLELQKEAAKIGMTATLGATVVTSMLPISIHSNPIFELLFVFYEKPFIN